MNAGALALRRTGVSLAEIARRVSRFKPCTRAAVSFWRNADRCPTFVYRVALREAFGIQLGAWDVDVPTSTTVDS